MDQDQLAPSMFGSLGGQMSVGQSMFGSMTPKISPTPDEIEAGRQRVMFKKHVETRGYHVSIFNMHVPKQARAYEKLMQELMTGMQTQTHKIFVNEFELLTTPKGQQWHRYVEWAEFDLQVEPTRPTGM